MQDLSYLIENESWQIFTLTGIDTSFFEISAESCMDNETYNNGKAIIFSLAVVNNGAERSVKLSHDYLHKAKKEKNLQSILQVVENEINTILNIKINKLNRSVGICSYMITHGEN